MTNPSEIALVEFSRPAQTELYQPCVVIIGSLILSLQAEF